MILCLDIGNTHIYAGVFDGNDIVLRFRYPSQTALTSDLFGIFLRDVFRENNLDVSAVSDVVCCSVVPMLDYSIRAACIKYLDITPLLLAPGVKTGLSLQVKNPQTLGADRIATAVAALAFYPQRNVIVVDFGTATTVCAVSQQKCYLGGAIFPGIRTSMQAICQRAAKLSEVTIVDSPVALGKTTEGNIQSGIYYSQLGGVQSLVAQYQAQCFAEQPALVLATGGFAQLFLEENYFDAIIPDLVFHGLKIVLKKNVD